MRCKKGGLMMKKNGSKSYIILGILFVLVSVIAFAVPSVKTAAFWLSYAFTVIAFIAQIIIWKAVFKRGESLKNNFLGFPVVYIGIVYLVLQIIALTVFLFAPALPPWSAIIACVMIVGISSVCMIAVTVGCSEIRRVEEKTQKIYQNQRGKDDGTGS